MPGFVGISTPAIVVNDETFAIVPNSFKYKDGKGERAVRPQSAGGGAVEPVVTENAETKKSMASFDVYPTPGNISKIEEWRDLLGANTIEATDATSGFSKSFANMTVINDPEYNLSQDGAISLEFEGSPAQ